MCLSIGLGKKTARIYLEMLTVGISERDFNFLCIFKYFQILKLKQV